MEDETLSKSTDRKKDFIILTIAVFASYAIFGFSDVARGPAIPRIAEEFENITELHIGALLTTNTIGYLIACSFTAALAKKIGMKTCAIIALLVTAFSGLLICYSPNFLMLMAAFFVLNLGFGMLEISLGVIAATTFTRNTGRMLNLAHFFYGFGSVCSPFVSSALMVATFGEKLLGWRYMYLIILSFALIPIIPALIGRLKKKVYNEKQTGYKALLRTPTLWLAIMIFALGAICEVGVASWLVNFLEKAYSFSPDKAALQLTLFFVVFTLSRLLLGPFTDKIGLINSLIIITAFTGVAITVGVLCGEAGTVILIVAGVGIALIFPTMMAVVAKLFTDEIDLAMTAVTTIMGLILIPANLAIGAIIQFTRPLFASGSGDDGTRLAYSTGYLFLGLCCFGACVFAMLLRRRQKQAGRLV